MNWDTVQGNWKQFKGKITAQWDKFSHAPGDVIAGKSEEVVGKIQESYGVAKDEVEESLERVKEHARE